jgi:hypothetical protein
MSMLACFLVFFLGAAENCKEWGYTEDLKCSACEKMNSLMEDIEGDGKVDLLDECQQCCKEDATKTYEKCTMSYPPRLTSSNQDLDDFIRNKQPLLKGLKLKEDRYSYKVFLKCYNVGDKKDVLMKDMHDWKSDTMHDFIKMHLGL